MSHKNAYFLFIINHVNIRQSISHRSIIISYKAVRVCYAIARTILPLASLDKSSVVRDMTETSTFFRSCLSFIVNNVNTTAGITDGTTTLYATESAVNQHEYQTPFILW